MLPGEDGWRITEALRSEGSDDPDHHDQRARVGARQGARPADRRRRLPGEAVRDARAGGAGGGRPAASGMVPSDRDAGRVEAPGLVVDADLHQALLDGQDAGLTRPSSGSCGCSRASRARRSRATSSSSGCGGRRTATATARWTCACASCARSSTSARRPTPTSRPTGRRLPVRGDGAGDGGMRIAVLGTGMVGRAIASKLVALGHEVTMGSRTADNESAAAVGGRGRRGRGARHVRRRGRVGRARLQLHGGRGRARRAAAAGAAQPGGQGAGRRRQPARLLAGPAADADGLQHRQHRRADPARVPGRAGREGAEHDEHAVMVDPARVPARTTSSSAATTPPQRAGGRAARELRLAARRGRRPGRHRGRARAPRCTCRCGCG